MSMATRSYRPPELVKCRRDQILERRLDLIVDPHAPISSPSLGTGQCHE
jgi:hypothetical protein